MSYIIQWYGLYAMETPFKIYVLCKLYSIISQPCWQKRWGPLLALPTKIVPIPAGWGNRRHPDSWTQTFFQWIRSALQKKQPHDHHYLCCSHQTRVKGHQETPIPYAERSWGRWISSSIPFFSKSWGWDTYQQICFVYLTLEYVRVSM